MVNKKGHSLTITADEVLLGDLLFSHESCESLEPSSQSSNG